MAKNRIKSPADRARYIEELKQRGSGPVLRENYYENLGDQAAVRSWYYDTDHGKVLYANTPDWVVKVAIRLGWVFKKGERNA